MSVTVAMKVFPTLVAIAKVMLAESNQAKWW